ncbi:unnamed protein product [Cuscuta campestris]|uniref:Ubiquitin-like protease family profile domain-containing protein n=1 Tax=Cuscuta campestris TaxID=132261 RepID=A0A484MMJ6_9ASTE|nr:unnamed protein product [Cuscuta campestris]
MDEVLKEHLEDVCGLVSKSCEEGNFEEGMEIILDSGLNPLEYDMLFDLKLECLKGLGDDNSVEECVTQRTEAERFQDAVALVAGYKHNMIPELLEIIIAGTEERSPKTSVFDNGFFAYTEVGDEMKPEPILTTEIPLQFNHIIGESLGNKLYKGIVTCHSWTRNMSFISATSSQIYEIDMLKNIGCENEFMVYVSHSVYDEVLLSLLVVEPLVPLRHFFRLQLDLFRSRGSKETTKGDWWKSIAATFTQIFGSEVPYIWLYNHPFFWSSQERVDFIKDLKEFMKEDIVDEKNLNYHLEACYSPCEPEIHWSRKIDLRVFEEIFHRPKVDHLVKKYDATLPMDMVRYMTACYSHINDYTYTYGGTREVPRIVEDIGAKVFQSIYPEASSIHPPRSSPMSKNIDWDKVPDRSSLSPCLRALLTCARNLNNGLIEIPVQKKVMNIPHSLRFGQEEMIELLKKGELKAIHIKAYIRLLYDEYEGVRDAFGFMFPSMISLDASEFQAHSNYIVCALDGSKNKVLFAPYNVGRHWILCLIDPKKGVVHYLNPSRAEPPEDLKNVVEASYFADASDHYDQAALS